jgi:hypothetical protein
MESTELVDLILERVETERMFPPQMTRLVKLLYLAEVEFYRRTQKRLTDLDWKFYHFGPYPPSLRTSLGDPNIEAVALTGGRVAKHFIRELAGEQRKKVDSVVAAVVSDVVHQWGDADLNRVLDYVYFETEPMQAANRGDYLDFTVVKPLRAAKPLRLEIDKKRLQQMRAKIAERAGEYEKMRQASVASDELFENLRLWDTGRAKTLPPGECTIDFDELGSSE